MVPATSVAALARYSRFIDALDHGRPSTVAHNPLANGVFLYIAYDPLFLSRVFCPERRPACPRRAIRLTSTGATPRLKSRVPTRQTFRRPKQQVQVVWHQNPGAPLESPLDLPSAQYPGDRAGR